MICKQAKVSKVTKGLFIMHTLYFAGVQKHHHHNTEHKHKQ